MIPTASRRLATVFVAALLVALPGLAGAQSLADVARAEKSRRQEQPTASKVYTNDSVKSDITPSTTSTPLPGVATSDAASAAAMAAAPVATDGSGTDVATAPSAGGERRDQAYWKNRISAAREQLERSSTFAEALQTRINALTADFVNRDDPAQQAQIGQNRAKAVAELDRVQREMAAQNKSIAAIEDEARKAGVPAGWLR